MVRQDGDPGQSGRLIEQTNVLPGDVLFMQHNDWQLQNIE
jgi:hypothetical protein